MVGGVFLLLVLFIYFALLRQSIRVTQHKLISVLGYCEHPRAEWRSKDSR